MKINAEDVLCISAILTQLSPRSIGSTLRPVSPGGKRSWKPSNILSEP